MKKILTGISLLTILATNVNAQAVVHKKTVKKTPAKTTVTSTVVVLKNANDSFNYAIGLNFAAYLKQQNIDQLSPELMKKGIQDGIGDKPALTEQQVNLTIQQRMRQAMDKKLNAEKEKGAAFLAANGKREGVYTLPSGVEYEVIHKSDSTVSPTEKDTVQANYVGSTIDGKIFDQSRNQPITISVTGVIKGWTEVLQKMHVGDKFKVYIPSDMAYGDRGAGNGAIPGGATLIFEIDLLKIISPAAPHATPNSVVVPVTPVK